MKQENFEIMEVISYASWWNVMIQKLHFRVTIHMISLQTAAFGKSPFVAIHTIVDRHFAKDCFPFLVRKNSISCPKQMWSVGFLLRGGKEIELVKESSDILVLKYISKIIKLHTKPGHLPLKSIQKNSSRTNRILYVAAYWMSWTVQNWYPENQVILRGEQPRASKNVNPENLYAVMSFSSTVMAESGLQMATSICLWFTAYI